MKSTTIKEPLKPAAKHYISKKQQKTLIKSTKNHKQILSQVAKILDELHRTSFSGEASYEPVRLREEPQESLLQRIWKVYCSR